MADPPTPLGIRPKGLPASDHVSYADLVGKGKLQPLNVFDVRSFGAAGDGSHDDSKAVQRAVDAAGKKDGGVVYLPPGTYILNSTVTLPAKSISIIGAGLATNIQGTADPLIQTNASATASQFILANLKIDPTKASAQVAVKIAQTWTADPHASFMIDNVWFLCNVHQDTVLLSIQGAREGAISNCWFETMTDKGTGIEIKGDTTDRTMNIVISACQFLTMTKGVYLNSSASAGKVEGITVADCNFIGGNQAVIANGVNALLIVGSMMDSGQATPLTLASCNWPIVTGCWLVCSGNSQHIVMLTGPTLRPTFTGNYFSSGGTPKGDGIRIEATPGAVRQPGISNNVFGSLATAINFGLSGGTIDQASIVGNSFSSCTVGVQLTGSPNRTDCVVQGNGFLTVTNPVVSGGGNIVRDNIGWVTENNGEATIASGTTAIVVTHGLSVTPNTQNISLTIYTSCANDIGYLYVTNITSTQFTINCAADPGAGGCIVGWQVIVTRS